MFDFQSQYRKLLKKYGEYGMASVRVIGGSAPGGRTEARSLDFMAERFTVR